MTGFNYRGEVSDGHFVDVAALGLEVTGTDLEDNGMTALSAAKPESAARMLSMRDAQPRFYLENRLLRNGGAR